MWGRKSALFFSFKKLTLACLMAQLNKRRREQGTVQGEPKKE